MPDTTTSKHLRTTTSSTYPYAPPPDILRTHQKDAYFTSSLHTSLSTILRSALGARYLHTHASETRVVSDLLYLLLTVGLGNRTLGEEYCDVVSVESASGQLPSARRRGAYVMASVVVPYFAARMGPVVRRMVRARLEAGLSSASTSQRKGAATTMAKVQTYLLENLDTITSPAPVYAVSLATFYFSGAYYELSKRMTGLRYIFSRNLPAAAGGDNRAGYEVLGVLLMLQVAVQGYLHVRATMDSMRKDGGAGSETSMPVVADATSGPSAVLDHGVEVSLDGAALSRNNAVLFSSAPLINTSEIQTRLARVTNTPPVGSGTARISLGLHDHNSHGDGEGDGKMGWLKGKQARRCTLCLEGMRDPSAMTCGHIFCWGCIMDWLREKAECPLCRQVGLGQHVLVLRG